MRKIVDLTGQRFGRLIVVGQAGRKYSNVSWLCKCDCGAEIKLVGYSLKRGTTKSCGCLKKEFATEYAKKHGMTGTAEYISWTQMLARCRNENNDAYPRYGGRGIKICGRWLESFENFYTDMGERPNKEYSLDRIENNSNYEPDNCRWATPTEQANNTRENIYLLFEGEKLTISEWERKQKMKRGTLWNRLYILKWPLSEAILTPVNYKRSGLIDCRNSLNIKILPYTGK